MFQHLSAAQRKVICDLYSRAKTDVILSERDRKHLVENGFLTKDGKLTFSVIGILLDNPGYRRSLGID